ncbi:glycosyltransferase [Arthrobacter sp. K5]|jgi:cellulose synthase (UDP-forming)|uniref:Glycosyltransferase n=1 Tax=Arthrobacter sp. K5 TaxID=2839623 RepID=A0AAU8EW70_9MICC
MSWKTMPVLPAPEMWRPLQPSGTQKAPRHRADYAMQRTSTMVTATSSGPLLSGRRAPRLARNRHLYTHILQPGQRIILALLTLGWALAFTAFWTWWLQPEHSVGWFGLAVNSVLLFYLSYLPSYFLIAVNRLRQINPALPVPELRCAFVVTKAPSEPWPVARATLLAMLAQQYPQPYDVWLCDEDPSDEAAAWCSRHRVRISTRRDVTEYHRPQWPRRTRCKEGNLAYFYDMHGYGSYDVVAQLDCDHVPAPNYLEEMVRPFADPSIGYVAAPSICDTNAAASWSARGRVHKEGTFHGPFQAGHIGGLAPLCIGSHYAVRTAAIKDIGGIGPELAEDFSTSFLLNSAGWQGAFAHNAEAHGEGPHTFAAKAVQEFQWSRSLVVLLIETLPRHLRRFPWALRLRFIFALSYYPLLAITTVGGLSLPIIAAVTGIPWVNVNYFEFLARWSLISVWLVLITFLMRRWGLMRPRNAPVLSWENWLYTLARWPFIAHGVAAAVRQKIRPRQIDFKVTPKSQDGLDRLPARLLLPYYAISLLMSTAALVGEAATFAYGYVFLCLLGSLSYAVVALAVPLLHAKESAKAAGARFSTAISTTAAAPLSVAVAVWVPLVAAVMQFPQYIHPFLQI